jgi:class 3 adenylate cyclase
MSQSRQLAAIMFTDIEGYTAIMQQDEQQALTLRNRHREVLQKEHAQYNGRIIQYYGDGTLSIFQSAIQAVQCAVAMQQAFCQPPRCLYG